MITETLRGPHLAATTSTASPRYSSLSDRRSALTLARGARPRPTLSQIEYPLGVACPDSGFVIASRMVGPSRRCAEPNGPSFTSRPVRDNRQLMQFSKSKRRMDAMIRSIRQAPLTPCLKPGVCAALSVIHAVAGVPRITVACADSTPPLPCTSAVLAPAT